MNIAIRIPTPLRPFTGAQERIIIDDVSTVKDALDALANKYPDLQQHLFDEQNNVRAFINVYLNDKDIRNLEGPNTRTQDQDELSLIPAIAGGRL